MNAKLLFFIAVLSISLSASARAASQFASHNPVPDPVMRQLKTTISDLKHEVNNHEAEIRTFEDKFSTQEATLEQFRQQFAEETQTLRDTVKNSLVDTESKIETLEQHMEQLETVVKGLTTDIRQIKTQTNDSFAQYKQKLLECEQQFETQNQLIQNMEGIIKSMMELSQAKQAVKEIVSKGEISSPKVYKVQPGDTLKKIAYSQKTTVKAIKELNNMENDRIIVGKTLQIP